MDHRGAEDERGEMRTVDTTVLLSHCKKRVCVSEYATQWGHLNLQSEDILSGF